MSQSYEYKAVPAPMKGEKARGAKTPSDRFALAVTAALNAEAAQGWEYLRADTLPSEERSGLTGRTTLFHNLLMFRRPVSGVKAPAPEPQARPTEPPPPPDPQAVAAATPPVASRLTTSPSPEVTAQHGSPVFSEPMRPAIKPDAGDKAG